MQKKSILYIFFILSIFSISCSENLDPIGSADKEITIGALLSLTGNWSSLGNTSNAALTIAAADINAYLTSIESEYRLKIKVEDTKLDTNLALQKLKSLLSEKIQIVIGPQSSAEIGAIKKYADDNNMLIISQGSTAGKYAVTNDNIFRFCPSDSLEGDAMAKLMWKEGIRVFVPFSSNDAGNLGLQKAAKSSFQKLGGTVTEGVTFEQSASDYSEYLKTIKQEIVSQKTAYGSEAVAVFVTTFTQIVEIFREGIKDTDLTSVNWYGSDGVVLINELVSDTAAARFAELTNFPCPTYGLDETNKFKWEPLCVQIKAQTGYEPDAFGLASYDALWTAVLAYISVNDKEDFSKLKTAFVHTADTYYGVTGATMLNNAGDRKFGYYDFWAVRKENGFYKWHLVGHSD